MSADLADQGVRQAQAVSDQGFALLDDTGVVTFCNGVLSGLYGLRPADLVGRGLADALAKADRKTRASLEPLEIWLRTRLSHRRLGASERFEIRTPTDRWFLVGDGTNPDGGTLLIFTDVTALKQRQIDLRQREAFLRQGSKLAGLGYWVWDTIKDRCVYASEEYARIYALTVTDCLSEFSDLAPLMDRIHPDDRDKYVKAITHGRKTGTSYDIEYRILGSDGEARVLREISEYHMNESGVADCAYGTLQDITEQKRREIALLRQELLQRQAHRVAGLAYWAFDPIQKRFLNAPEIGLVLGTDHERLDGQTDMQFVDDFVHPSDRERVRRVYQKRLNDGEVSELEYQVIRGDGEVRVIHEIIQARKAGDSDHVVEFGTIQDITERKRTEIELRGHNDVLERLANDDPLDEILLHLAEHTEALRPGMMCSICLVGKRGRRLWNVAAPSLPQSFKAAINGALITPDGGSCGAAAHSGQRVIAEDVLTHPIWRNMKVLAIEAGFRACWSEPIKSSTGSLLGTFAMCYRDPQAPSAYDLALITRTAQLARIAIERRRTLDALHQSLDYLKRSQEMALISYWMWDAREDLITVPDHNPSVNGVPPADITGLTIDQYIDAYVHPEDRALVRQTFRPPKDGLNREIEFRVIRPDGEIRTMRDISRANLNEDGDLDSVAGTMQDITDRKAAEEQLNQALKMEAVGQLTGGIAHEFNNMLAVIQGNLDLLKDQIATDKELLSFIEPTLRATQRATELTQTLLTFSRKQALRPSAIDLNELVANMLGLIRPTLGEAIEIDVVADTALWTCYADPAQLEHALLNLAINARDAMPRGGRLTISTENRVLSYEDAGEDGLDPGEYVRLAVTDTGTGMTQEVRQSAFEPFFSTKDVGQGTGLGLSMIYGFVKQSGGQILIDSAVGSGTTVAIYLPRTEPVGEVEPAEGRSDGLLGHGETILIVENEPDIRALAMRLLGSFGYSVLTANDCESAITMAESVPRIDLLLADVDLPDPEHKRSLIQTIRGRHPDAKVLFLSGFPLKSDMDDERQDDSETYLIAKPFTKMELAKRVALALHRAA